MATPSSSADTGPGRRPDVSFRSQARCLSVRAMSLPGGIIHRPIAAGQGGRCGRLPDTGGVHGPDSSTATINDSSSARFQVSPRTLAFIGIDRSWQARSGSQVRAGPIHAHARLPQPNLWTATSRAFRACPPQNRELSAEAADGSVLQGTDRFVRPNGGQPRAGTRIDPARFPCPSRYRVSS